MKKPKPNKRVVYSAIFGKRDYVKIHSYINKDFDYVLFVDEQTYDWQKNIIEESNWNVTILSNYKDPIMIAKDIKINPHEWVGEYTGSIWLDGSFKHIGDLNNLYKFSNKGIMAFAHPKRPCAYDEAEICINNYHQHLSDQIGSQVENYKEIGFPENFGLWMGGILVRRHTQKQSLFSRKWWTEIKKGSVRDQISLPYVSWKLKQEIITLDNSLLSQTLLNSTHYVES